jgi:hypothetical protein
MEFVLVKSGKSKDSSGLFLVTVCKNFLSTEDISLAIRFDWSLLDKTQTIGNNLLPTLPENVC